MDFDTLFNHLGDDVLQQLDQEFRPSNEARRVAQSTSPECAAQGGRASQSGDFERLVRFAEPLVVKYDDISSAEWELSQIGWIRQVSSALKRGKIGEELVTAWAHSEGLIVAGRSHRGHDCVLNGMKVEVKTSLRWNNDRFVFLGLRDFDYDAVALLGLEPDDVRLWIVPKALLWQHAREQLRSAEAVDTKWLSFIANEPPSWLDPWGGTFAQARRALRDAAAYSQTPSEEQSAANDGADDDHLGPDEAWLQLAAQIDWPWHSTPSDHTQQHDQSQPQQHPQTQTPIVTPTERNDSHVSS